MTAYEVGAFVGGIIAAVLFSALFGWVLKKLFGPGVPWIVPLGVAYVFCVVGGGFGFANGGAPVFGQAAATYAVPFAIVALGKWFLHLRNARKGA